MCNSRYDNSTRQHVFISQGLVQVTEENMHK